MNMKDINKTLKRAFALSFLTLIVCFATGCKVPGVSWKYLVVKVECDTPGARVSVIDQTLRTVAEAETPMEEPIQFRTRKGNVELDHKAYSLQVMGPWKGAGKNEYKTWTRDITSSDFKYSQEDALSNPVVIKVKLIRSSELW